jgi:hypothetical protein
MVRRSTLHPAVAAAFVCAALAAPAGASAQSATDCFADRVAAFRVGYVSSPPAFNTWQTGILFGPPGSTSPTNGSLSVVSLGRGGEIVVEFTDNVVVDGPGPDFIVFENAFFCSTVPPTAADPWAVFAEPGIVAASADGIEFRTFPHDSGALAAVVSQCSDKTLLARLGGLAGVTPSFTGNWTVPDDPLVFDPLAPGGVSGHGGDAFDLAAVGLAEVRFLRITDPDLGISLAGASEGFDLDGVVAIHSRPRTSAGRPDGDADGLADDDERILYGSNPGQPDSDGDGVDDGREVAGCRNPVSQAADPWFVAAIDLEASDAAATVLRWSDLGGGITYDVVRGDTGALRATGGLVDLGVVACLENDSTDLTTRTVPDTTAPAAGRAFFYVVRQAPRGSGLGYGLSSSGEPRVPASGDCP